MNKLEDASPRNQFYYYEILNNYISEALISKHGEEIIQDIMSINGYYTVQGSLLMTYDKREVHRTVNIRSLFSKMKSCKNNKTAN